jgi:hypothetical protein
LEHGLLIGCHISTKSVKDIATLVTLPKSTVGDVIVKWKCEGTTQQTRTGKAAFIDQQGPSNVEEGDS